MATRRPLPRRALFALTAVVALLLTAAPAGSPAAARGGRPPLVAAASDLNLVLPEIAKEFAAETGLAVELAFGSSGNFARQIRQGAPFEVFLSADENYVHRLAGDGLTRDAGVLYASGRIVLFVANGSPLAADANLEDLRRALRERRLGKFAIANPEHAPYGRAAEETLRRAGLWESIRPHLVFGENVSQAAQFAASAAADGGIIAYSLALSPALANRGRYALIADDRHPPLRQRAVLLAGAGDVAARFYAFLQTPAAGLLFARYGFATIGGSS
jgi:molybdate transport system substrate-binding protein